LLYGSREAVSCTVRAMVVVSCVESAGWDYIWAASGELHDCPELVSLLAINSVPWRCRGGVRWCCRGATGVAAGAAAVATGAATGMIPVGIASCVSSIWDDGAA
jgi:hypothetical protein